MKKEWMDLLMKSFEEVLTEAEAKELAIEQETIVAKQKITYYLAAIYPKAVAACLVILMGFIAYLYLSEGNLDTEILVGIADLSPDEAYSFLEE